jgi:hypothetical protein
MTDHETVTLNRFFSSETELSVKKLMKADSRDNVADLKKKLTQEVKVVWPVACGFILKEFMEILNMKVSDVMIAAWNQYKALVQYTDEKKYPPGESYLVPLAKHTIESIHKPFLEILVNHHPVGKINFEIIISLAVEGIVLKIQDGKIMEVRTGSCKGGGSIKCEDKLILKKETGPFSLPGLISLGEGIPIPV